MTKIVVVGGGAGGLEFTAAISRRFKKDDAVTIELVDRKMTHVWKPLFHEVAAGTRGLGGDEVHYLSLAHMHGFRFHVGDLTAVDPTAQTVTLAARSGTTGQYLPERNLSYDYLVLALGSAPRTFGIFGVSENCYFLDTLDEAHKFRTALFEHCLRLDSGSEINKQHLHVTIIGGGATGVELAAEMCSAIRQLTQYGFDHIDIANAVHISLIEAGPRLLGGLDEKLATSAKDELQRQGVTVHLNCSVTSIAGKTVFTNAGEPFPSDMIAWVAGIGAPPLLGELGSLPLSHAGYLQVDEDLSVPGFGQIFAFGDCATCEDKSTGKPLPPKAQVASQQAAYLAKTLGEQIKSATPLPAFKYQDRGSLVNLAHHKTVGQMMGNLLGTITFEGWVARQAYNYLYRRHQVATHGFLRGNLMFLSEYFSSRVHPRLKLH